MSTSTDGGVWRDVIVIVDYGLGNRGSIVNMLSRMGIECRVSSDPQTVAAADSLILPGVGAFDAGMRNLAERELVAPIRHAVLERRAALLGICLGMQLLSDGSEEGALPGLGLIPGRCVRFRPAEEGGLPRIPHMGWAEIEIVRAGRLFPEAAERPRFYFVHSYHLVCERPTDVVAEVRRETSFTAAVEHGRVFGCQFHPEKSHRFGMAVMQAFAGVPAA